MARSYAPKTYNAQRRKQREKEMEELAPVGHSGDLLAAVGGITTTYEKCEEHLFQLFAEVTTDRELLRTVFNLINSRATRNQVLTEFLETHTPRRRTKRFDLLCELFKRYDALGAKRDEVAHGIIHFYAKADRPIAAVIQPALHRERKFIVGIPVYHYDLPALKKLNDEIVRLLIELEGETLALAARHTRLLEAGRWRPVGQMYVPAPEGTPSKPKPRSRQKSSRAKSQSQR